MGKLNHFKIYLYPIIAILVYHVTFVKYYYVKDYTIPTIIMIIPICLYLFLNINKILKTSRYKAINSYLIIFSCLIFISSLINFSNFDSSILFICKLWICFLFFEYIHIIKKIDKVLLIYIILSTVYAIVSLKLYNTNISLFYDYGKNYFIGNKFDVAYIVYISFMMLYAWFNIKEKNGKLNKLILISYYIFSMYVSNVVGCSTMIVGNLLTLLFLLIPNWCLKKESNIIITIVVSTVFLFVFSGILNISFIHDFIVNVLNKDTTLTGRMKIYSNIFTIIWQNLFFGVGYGNSYSTFMNIMNAPNAQNALLDWVVQIGVIGTVFLLQFVNKIFKNLKLKDMKKFKPIIVALYIFSILGMVEITINMCFFTLLAIVNSGYLLEEKGSEKDERQIIN